MMSLCAGMHKHEYHEVYSLSHVKKNRVYICYGMVLLKHHYFTLFLEHIYLTLRSLCIFAMTLQPQVVMSLLRHTRIMACT
jgi:hypothetical protein